MRSNRKLIYIAEILLIAILVTVSACINAGPILNRKIVYLIPVIILFDLFLIEKDYVQKHRSELFSVFLIIFLSSLPLFLKGLKYGDDLIFHLNRIEGIYLGLKGGIFPVKIQPNWFNGAGYASGVMYGDIFLYIPAILRMAGFEVYASYKIFLFIINAATVVVAYFSYSRIFDNKKIGLLCSFIYALSPYRLINIYRRAAVGESLAMTVLPLITLAVFMIYSTECRNKDTNRKIVIMLTAGMSVLIQSHILSTEMTVLCIAAVCIVMWKKTFRKNVIAVYLRSALFTALLSMYFLVPFLDYMANQDMWLKEQLNIGVFRNIENNALSVGNLFTFFYTNFTDYDTGKSFNPGLILMAVLVISVFLLINGKLEKRARMYFWFSLGFLVLSSDLFPWRLWGKTPLGYLMTSVQSPWRFITYAVCFLTLLFGELYKIIQDNDQFRNNINIVLITLSVVCISVFSSAYDEYSHTASYNEGSELDSFFAGGREYVPVEALESIPETFSISEGGEITDYSRNLYRFSISANTSAPGYIDLPLLNYKGYAAADTENGRIFEITAGPSACVRILIPENFSGEISVDFREPWYWRAGELLSLITLLGFIALSSIKRIMPVSQRS